MRSLVAALPLCVLLGNATQAVAQDSGASVKFKTVMASVDDGRPTRYDAANYRGRVATGERFKASVLAVAHCTLPLGSRVMLSYRNRTAEAVVNDRGPCCSDHCRRVAPQRVLARDMDMTPAVATRLNFPGLGRVAFWLLK